MFVKNNLISNKYIFLALIISLIVFIQKWILSYIFFPDDLSLKIIFDSSSDGYFYFIHLKSLSSLEFNNSFDRLFFSIYLLVLNRITNYETKEKYLKESIIEK